ncbi:MAG: hypothetical protein LBI31_05035 [Zoogloeaceae bacterium]|jgi:hypothetical protein|nr:hypothetical protein [Zoogloeaceae bacterium]
MTPDYTQMRYSSHMPRPANGAVALVNMQAACRYRLCVVANLTGGQLADKGYWRRHVVTRSNHPGASRHPSAEGNSDAD